MDAAPGCSCPRQPDAVASEHNNLSGNFLVPAKRLNCDGARRSLSRKMMHVTRKSLLLLFITALPTLLLTVAARADSCDHKTVAASGGAAPLGTAILINEDSANSQGERHVGSVCWRLDQVKANGKPDEVVVHAEIDIPDLAFKMAMDFKHNADRSAAARHFVEITFVQPNDAAGGAVVSVPGILLKVSERARGTPLVGQTVKVTNGSFLVGLSGHEADGARNLQLLKERPWFDIPIFYASQRRGILAVEKGYRGEQMFLKAMTEWERAR